MSGCYAPGVAAFDYKFWQFSYPELAQSVPEPVARAYFAEAGLYLDNSPRSAVKDCGKRALILGMLVAHIAKLRAPIDGQPASSLVGRISQASEGSVSVTADLPEIPGTAAWFAQTQYGLSAWQALAPYRMARYIPGNRPYLGVGPTGRF